MRKTSLLEHAAAVVSTSPLQALELADRAASRARGVRFALVQQVRTRALRALGRHEEALDAFAAAAQAAAAGGNTLLAAQVQIGAVDTLGMLGRYEEAAALASTLTERLQEFGARDDAAKVMANLGNLHLRRDRYAEAIDAYTVAETLFSESADPLLFARVAVNRAIALTYQGQDAAALAAYQEARERFAARGQSFEVAVIGSNIGFLHGSAGRYAAALAELTTAYQVFAATDRPHEAARCDLDTGDVYRALNLLAEARVCYERALTVFEHLPLDDDRARAHLGLAAIALEQARFSDAHAALDQAEAHFAQQQNTVSEAHVRLRRAETLLRQEQGNAARIAAEQAREVFAAAGLAGWAAEARLLTVLADADTTPEVFSDIIAAARQTARGWLECRAESALGRQYQRQGDRGAARDHFRRAVDALEAIRTQIAPEHLHLSFLSDKEAVYAQLVELLLQDSPGEAEIAEAFEVIERSRSRLLLERLLAARLPGASMPENALRDRLAELRAKLSRAYRDALSLSPEEASRHAEAIPEQALAPLETAYAQALHAAELEGELPDGILRQPLPDLVALQAALSPDEVLVLFTPVGDRLAAFVVGQECLMVRPAIAAWSEVRYTARRFRYHLQKMAVPPELRVADTPELLAEMDAVLERLHEQIIRPIADLLTNQQRLVIVPCGPLHGLPFHALKQGDERLLDRYEIVYAPSASVWYALSRQSEAAAYLPGRAVLVGVSGPGTEHVAGELEAIRHRIPHAAVLCGSAATIQNVRCVAPSAALLHLATHALFRCDNPLFSGLQLADDWLLGRDLYDMHLSADLVTLSACDTGAARIEPGEEWMGLARGFLAAGARRVLVSLWPADDAATAEWMARFYGRLQETVRPAAALRQTYQEMRTRHPHPYYWSAFCLIGRH